MEETRKNGREYGKAVRDNQLRWMDGWAGRAGCIAPIGPRQVVSQAPHRPAIGEAAPEIALTDFEGNLWRSEDHRGRAVVVIFHRHIH